jgi:hypothetical protein
MTSTSPGKLIIANRGLFFYDPNYKHYADTLRPYANRVMFESYFTDRNNSDQTNAFFADNKYDDPPRLNAEAGRPDGFTMIALGYDAGVLVDTHRIGGSPEKGEIYGWASWTPRKGILVLRNPSDQPATFRADLRSIFELPSAAPKAFHFRSPWKSDRSKPAITIEAGQSYAFQLQPFEVLVLESR